jgi:hypothetical protein
LTEKAESGQQAEKVVWPKVDKKADQLCSIKIADGLNLV